MERYTHGHAPSVLRSHRWRTVENSAAYLVDRLVPGAEVLDVGCGPASITVDIARRVAPGRVVGIDAADDAVAAAAQAVRDAGVDNVELARADVYSLDVADASFDVVHAHQVLQHLAEPVAALREMRRVARPDGVVAARDSIYRAMTWFPASPLLDRWLELYCEVAEANGGEPDAGSHLLAWAHAAGLDDVTCTATAWCYATPEERAWWGGLWAERTESTAFGARAVELGFATPDELATIAAAWRTWSGQPDGWFMVPSGEMVARTT
jgi:SAM-dependent methyltransferase